jgi:thioredoxin-dependent peroxiredoxin
MLTVGQPAPSFTLTTHQGKPVSLGDFRGRKVLIWFFPEAGSPGCSTEARSFRDHQEYFDENNVVLLGASFNNEEDNAAFAAKESLPFPLLCDTNRTLSLAYGACDDPKAQYPERVSVLIDEQGSVERLYLSVDPRDHAARVLADLIDALEN